MKDDIREKIRKIIDDNTEYEYRSVSGEGDYLTDYGLDKLLSLIHQEIESAIPKEKEDDVDKMTHDEANDDYYRGSIKGYNQAISDIRTALKEKGLL